MKGTISIELVEDVKELVGSNLDVKISDELKNKLDGFGSDELVEIKKEIGSLKITNIELVTEESVKRGLIIK